MAVVACGGGDSSSPTSPSSTAAITITITDAGVSPSQVSITLGSAVQFVNNSSVNREMRSGPHPAHTDCPPINDLALLAPGQTGQTGPLTLEGVCSFHDNITNAAAAWVGVILVGTSDSTAAAPAY